MVIPKVVKMPNPLHEGEMAIINSCAAVRGRCNEHCQIHLVYHPRDEALVDAMINAGVAAEEFRT